MYSCFKGELLASLQVRTICAQHATGAALIVERINDPRIEDAGRKLAQALSLSGFFGLDFLLENGSGYPYLLEMNPRATQLGHLPLENPGDGGSLAEALWLAWTGNEAPQPPTLRCACQGPAAGCLLSSGIGAGAKQLSANFSLVGPPRRRTRSGSGIVPDGLARAQAALSTLSSVLFCSSRRTSRLFGFEERRERPLDSLMRYSKLYVDARLNVQLIAGLPPCSFASRILVHSGLEVFTWCSESRSRRYVAYVEFSRGVRFSLKQGR